MCAPVLRQRSAAVTRGRRPVRVSTPKLVSQCCILEHKVDAAAADRTDDSELPCASGMTADAEKEASHSQPTQNFPA
jgi:hypothetical protein